MKILATLFSLILLIHYLSSAKKNNLLFIKPYLTLFALLLAGSCFSQTEEKSKGFDKSNLSVGLIANANFDFLDHPIFYIFPSNPTTSFSNQYISDRTNESNASFYQAHVQYRWQERLYSSASIGVGIDNIDASVTYLSEYANVGVGGSEHYKTTRNIRIRETRSSIVGSLEVGTYFLKSEKPFQFGVGMGVDIIGYLEPKVVRNELVQRVNNTIYTSNPTNPGTTTYSSTTTFNNESEEWNTYVLENSWSAIAPKLTLTAMLRINKSWSIFGKAQVRYTIQAKYLIKNQGPKQFPVGGGILYRF